MKPKTKKIFFLADSKTKESFEGLNSSPAQSAEELRSC